MRQVFLFLLAVVQSSAAIQTVCPASYGSCTYTDVQAALTAVACGTELDLAPIVWTNNYHYSQNCSGNPVVVTTMRKAFLPLAGERLSPSHYYNAVSGVGSGSTSSGNIAILNTNNASSPINITAPTKGLHVIGIGFTTTAYSTGYTYFLFDGEAVTLTDYASASDDIVLDRCYFSGPESAGTNENTLVQIQSGLVLEGSNVTLENSTVKDVMYRGVESHGITMPEAIGPVTLTNNFISASSIPIFSGGNEPRFWPTTQPLHGSVPVGLTIQHNFLYKPYKWQNDPVNNPYYADYQAFCIDCQQPNGSYADGWEPCTKNLGENKNGTNILWQYNVHENQWEDGSENGNEGECEGQSFGFSYAPRGDSRSDNFTANPPASYVGTTTSTTTFVYNSSATNNNGGLAYAQVTVTATSNGSPDVITAPGNTVANGQLVWIGAGTGYSGDTAILCSVEGGGCHAQNVGAYGAGTFTLTTASGVQVNGNGIYTGGAVLFPPFDGNGNPPSASSVNNGFMCLYYNNTYYTCRYLTNVNLTTRTITIANDPVSGTGWLSGQNVQGFIFAWDAAEAVTNFTMQNEVFRNVNKQQNFLAQDISPGNSSVWKTPNAVGFNHATVQNNLWTNTRLMCNPCKGGDQMWGVNFFNSDNPFEPATRSAASGYNWLHNTFYFADALNPASTVRGAFQTGDWAGSYGTPLDLFTFNNNIAPPSQYGLSTQVLGFGAHLADALTEWGNSDAKFNNNSLPGITVGTCSGGNTCTGNINNVTTMDDQFVQPPPDANVINRLQSVMKVASTSAFYKAGTDGLDLGVDVDNLALINGVAITPGPYSAIINWDLTGVNNAVPCVVEVTTSRNIFSGLGPYQVVNSVNPTLFKDGPDSDWMTNATLIGAGLQPIIAGTHRTFVVGTDKTVTDDNGNNQSLALTPGTLYWGRLQCGGDTQWFTFTTLARRDRVFWASPARASLKLQAPAGAGQATVSYGSDQTLGQTITATPDSSGNVEFQVPFIPGSSTFYQVSFLVGANIVTTPIGSF